MKTLNSDFHDWEDTLRSSWYYCLGKKTYSKAKAKMQKKILGHTDFLKNRIKKDTFKKFFRLMSNKSTLLIQHDIICRTDNAPRNAFPMVKLSKSISHEQGNKIALTKLSSHTVTVAKRFISSSVGKIHQL